MSTSNNNNAAVATAAVGDTLDNKPPSQWDLCGSITGLEVTSDPSDFNFGDVIVPTNDVVKSLAENYRIENPGDIHVEIYFIGGRVANANIRARPSKDGKIHKTVTEILQQNCSRFVPNRHAISGSIHFEEWLSEEILDKIAKKIGTKEAEIIKRLAKGGISDWKLANIIFKKLLTCKDSDGGLDVGLELLCAHHATDFHMMFVRNSDYYASQEVRHLEERTSARQLATTILGCWQVDKQKGGVFLFPVSFVAMGVSVGQKAHEKGYDNNEAYDGMVSYLPRIVNALKAAGKKLTILVEDPLRFHRMPYALRSMIEEVKGLGADVVFMSNWGEDIISKIDGIVVELEGDDADDDVIGTHNDPVARSRTDTPKQQNIIATAERIAPKLGTGGQLDELLKEATVRMDQVVSGLDIKKGGIVWSGKGGLLTKAKSVDMSMDEKLELANTTFQRMQNGHQFCSHQSPLGSNGAHLLWNRCSAGWDKYNKSSQLFFQLDLGDGNTCKHPRNQTAMGIALLLEEGFLLEDEDGVVTVKDGKDLFMKTVFRCRTDPCVREFQQIITLMALKAFDCVVVKLSPRISAYLGLVQVIDQIGLRGGCTIRQSWGVDFTLEDVAKAEEKRQETLAEPFARKIIAIPANKVETSLSRDLRLLANFGQWDSKGKTVDEARKKRRKELLEDSVGGMIGDDDEYDRDDDSSNDEYEYDHDDDSSND